MTVYWAFSVEDDCHGPIYHSRYDACVVTLDPDKSKFQEELIAISNCFQVSVSVNTVPPVYKDTTCSDTPATVAGFFVPKRIFSY